MEYPNPEVMDKIVQAASRIRKERPAYEPLIDFYQDLFLAQENSKSRVNVDPVIIARDLVDMKVSNGFPLIEPWQFSLDVPEALELMATLSQLAEAKVPKLEQAARAIHKAVREKKPELSTLFSDLLKGREEQVSDLASDLDISVEELSFFAHAAMAPSIRTGALQLARYLKPGEPQAGVCPVCGSSPAMGYFDQNGARYLACSLCRHTWMVKRMGCALCQSQDAERHHYFFSESEKGYRVDLCDACRRYLKIVDTREIPRDFFPDLELVTTLHLDIKAMDQGYTSQATGVPSPE
ncbi:MAG: formate dehydrogenase accessory protein FdhE [Pseudomonadota bacterium]